MAINLIPPKIKEEKKLNRIMYQVTMGLSVIFAITIIFAGSLFFYNSYLNMTLGDWQQKIDDQKIKNKPLTDIENEIKKINGKITKIDSLQKNSARWSTILESLANATPKNIQVTGLNLDKNSGLISLEGVAATRKDIAFMKEKLEENSNFNNVTFSTSSFNEQTNDYNFNLSMSLDLKSVK